jgi:guanyl-specific ribonuclease Sa
MSPDYDGDSDEIEPVPYASFSNPQSLNLYAYVGNNPLSQADSTGHHQECDPDTTTDNGDGSYTVTAGACHEVPDPSLFQRFMNWRQGFADRWNQRIEANKPPPQPNNKGQALQDLNNIMMGAVPMVGIGLVSKANLTLESIETTGKAPAGQQGGQDFMNDGRGGGQQLPMTDGNGNPIKYQEWDVNAKQPGVNRGADRLVTGSDGSAYVTADHYQTFMKIK